MGDDRSILDSIRELVSNVLKDNGIELVDIELKGRGGGRILSIAADKDGGITLDECANMSGLISEALDKADMIRDKYLLEVSSPGLDRPLKTSSDFENVIGKMVRVHTYVPIGDRRDLSGELISVAESEMVIAQTQLFLRKQLGVVGVQCGSLLGSRTAWNSWP